MRQKSNMDGQRIAAFEFRAQLTQRFKEGQALDIARGAANFYQDHIGVGLLREPRDAALDFVRNMRDDLDRAAEIVALAFLFNHLEIDLARGHIGEPADIFVDEALVMPQIKVRFGAIGRDKNLAMLVGAHCAGVDVQIRIQLLYGDLQPARLQNPADGRDRQAFAHRTDDAAGAKDEFGFHSRPSILLAISVTPRKTAHSQAAAALD